MCHPGQPGVGPDLPPVLPERLNSGQHSRIHSALLRIRCHPSGRIGAARSSDHRPLDPLRQDVQILPGKNPEVRKMPWVFPLNVAS